MNETPAPQPRPATRTTTYVAPRRTIRLSLPDGWARAALSGIETVFMGWALVTLASVLSYASVSSNPWMGKATWEGAFALGADLLGVVLGAPAHVGEVSYWAPPTLLGLLLVLVLRLFLRPGKKFPATAQWFAVPAFAFVALLIVGGGSHYVKWWEAVPGALLVPALASGWAYYDGADDPLRRWGVPAFVREGLRQGVLLVGAVLALGTLGAAAALASHVQQIAGIHALLLTTSRLGDVLVGIGQALYAPTLIAWALAWLAGPGVLLGVDAPHSPVSAPTLPIPGIPVLGAFPTATPGYWTILLPIALGAGLGALLGRRRRRLELGEQASVAGIAVVLFAIVWALWLFSSALHLGSARMALVGPEVVPALLALVAEVGAGFVLASIAVHPRAIAWMRRQWEVSRLGPGQTAEDLPAAPSVPLATVSAERSSIDEDGVGVYREGDEEAPGLVDAYRADSSEDDDVVIDEFPEDADASEAPAESPEDAASAPAKKTPTAPIPVLPEDLWGGSDRVEPAVKSPAQQAKASHDHEIDAHESAELGDTGVIPTEVLDLGAGASEDADSVDEDPVEGEPGTDTRSLEIP